MRTAQRIEADRQAALATLEATGGDGAGLSPEARAWHLTNSVEVTSNAYWAPDQPHMNAARKTQLWRSNEGYFNKVCISAIAAVKMLIHAKRGMPTAGRENWFEVMGLMMGHFKGDTLYVTDSFGLPVDASEVECSMNENSMFYQVEYMNYHRRIGKLERGCIGWYHSHPGYTCFMSGIDVNTQQLNQASLDPWVAIVVDPVGTIASGKMDIKAFRTYTEAHVRARPDADVPLSGAVVRKRGLHAARYYELPITLVRSERDAVQLDALLGQYCALTFSTNPLVANRGFHTHQLTEIAGVVAAACGCGQSNNSNANSSISGGGGGGDARTQGQGRSVVGARHRAGQASDTAAAAGSGAAPVPAAASVYDTQWGPYQRTAEAVVERNKAAEDLVDAKGPDEVRAIQQSAELTAEVMLGGVQLSLKNAVFKQ